MKGQTYFYALVIMMCLASCNTSRNISYFQDAGAGDDIPVPVTCEIILAPGAEIQFMVCVNSNPELTTLFCYPEANAGLAAQNNFFVINEEGNMTLPLIGTFHAAGLRRSELEKLVRQKIIDYGFHDGVSVTATYLNGGITLVGEVNRPGRYELDRDYMTILEAIAQGQDLTINGRRDNVTVVRNINGVDYIFQVDLRSLRDVINSPAYYLRNNDIVYVQPTNKRIRESVDSGNDIYDTSFWLQMTSLEIQIIKLIDTLNNR